MKIFVLIAFLVVFSSALPSRRGGKIWNGDNATPGQAPYMVGMLRFEIDGSDQPLTVCGGAVVNIWWIITVSFDISSQLYNFPSI